jgi:FMN-dependent NADH-azoreductase
MARLPSPRAGLDHQETYLTSFLDFLGVKDVTFIRAEGVAYGAGQRERAIESALAAAAALQTA